MRESRTEFLIYFFINYLASNNPNFADASCTAFTGARVLERTFSIIPRKISSVSRGEGSSQLLAKRAEEYITGEYASVCLIDKRSRLAGTTESEVASFFGKSPV